LDSTSVVTPAVIHLQGSSLPVNANAQIKWGLVGQETNTSPIIQVSQCGALSYDMSIPDGTSAGAYDVFVRNVNTGAALSSTTFNVVSALTSPQARVLNPDHFVLDAPGTRQPFSIVISGSGFVSASFVRINYARQTILGDGSVHNAGELVGVVLSSAIQETQTQLTVPLTLERGDYTVSVVNPGELASAPLSLVVSLPDLQPNISNVQPPSAAPGQLTTLDASGSNFQYGMSASVTVPSGTISITQANVTFVSTSDARIVVNMPGPGPYTSKLTVTNPGGLGATSQFQVNAVAQGVTVAHFTMSGQGKSATDGAVLSLTAAVNTTVQVSFDGSSTIVAPGTTATSWAWKSGGTPVCGNSSTCALSFSSANNTVTLIVTDSKGASSTATGQVSVLFPQSGPTAHFNMSAQGKATTDGGTLSLSVPVNGNVDVSFTSTSTPGGAAITTYAWKSNGTAICGNSSTCTFNFGTASNTITLTTTDSNNQTSTATGAVALSFQSGPAAHFSMSAQGKSASDGGTLSLSVPVNGNVDVSFTSTSAQGGAAITAYAWKSNGTAICGNSSTCTFNFGTVSNTITLVVTDSSNQTSTATGTVVLSFQSGPAAHFSMSAQSKTANDGGTLSLSVPVNGNVTVNFSSTSTQGGAAITTYAWKSNGTAICGNSSTCTFNFGTASNTITLTVTDSNNQTSTATGTVVLSFQSGPAAHFSMSAQSKTANSPPPA
jgi:hypothetical protein